MPWWCQEHLRAMISEWQAKGKQYATCLNSHTTMTTRQPRRRRSSRTSLHNYLALTNNDSLK